ncbi:DNA phosphorothioation-dependent restriction protein DptH [Terribacillus saccharophilus]|uniref:DNA phosphorothioation-dependent restriction protein DptH n=1 Tax=Terribacillus saccharophilus TaxID=361277 RepID=UPI0014731E55|nr:DNA phosphorothioation-dependent restriction protein DptH [Terribacillus goriensis]
MSSQFFKFIATLISDFFSESPAGAGDRYYVVLNNMEDVKGLKRAFEEEIATSPFKYPLENGRLYVTRELKYKNGADLVLANTDTNITNDFLVTLRNRVGDQFQDWKGKSLLSIITGNLDSISGGSISLQSEGMPLNPKELSKIINRKIDEDISNVTDKIVLTNYISEIDNERLYQFTTFYDYKEVLEILEKGFLSKDDYQDLGMFKDSQLESYKGSNLEKRLKKNKELYGKIESLNELNQDRAEYERLFLDKDISKIKKDNWRELDFKTVYKSHEDRIKATKKTKVTFRNIQSSPGCVCYQRQLSDKGAGQRKIQLLIYAEAEKQLTFDLYIDVLFSERAGLDKEFLNHNGSAEVSLKKSKVEVVIKTEAQKAVFEKINYNHENKSSLGVEFSICVLPFPEQILENYHSVYEIKPKEKLIKLPFDNNELKIGTSVSDETEISGSNTLLVTEPTGTTFKFKEEDINAEERLLYSLEYKETKLKIELVGEKPDAYPIQANKLAKIKRESQSTFELKESKVADKYYVSAEYRGFLELEKEWLSNIAYSGYFNSGFFVKDEDVKLPFELRDAYSRFVNCFLKKPISLTYWDKTVRERALDYVNAFIKTIEIIDDSKPAGKNSIDLYKLGVIYNKNGEEIWLTPFHPLNVAFELRKLERIETEPIELGILDRLKPDSLLPFIYDNSDQEYSPDSQKNIPGWIFYKKVDDTNVVDADLYLNKVIKDKLFQFEEHFDYLFLEGSSAPISVNIINILNDYQAVRGLVQWYLERRTKTNYLPPVNVNIYREKIEESYCEHFTEISNVEDFERVFDLRLKPKNQTEAPEDILADLHENINFYLANSKGNYSYAHISFYKMEAQQYFAIQPIEQMDSGISMGGLYNSVPSKKFDEDYRSGFGTRDYAVEKNDILIRCAYFLNELTANIKNQASNTYVKGRGTFSRTTLQDINNIKKILDVSNWVTFIDPGVELDFFDNITEDLLVIHYNDQYSSSSRYDAITVTSRSSQYYNVIKEFFDSLSITPEEEPEHIKRTISAFNTLNGEWLLRIIGSRGHFTEEKLSIIAAVKTALAYFNHDHILWVPVSLEEVLRVAGAVNLSRTGGIFTAKNLGVTGKHSDDVLLLGLEYAEELKIHVYPIEVKIGINNSSVMNKAREQVSQTSKLLEEELIQKEQSFLQSFYQNFFVQLFISNAKRMSDTKFWPEKEYNLSPEIIEKLRKGQYHFVSRLNSHIGLGAIISFKDELISRTNEIEENILTIHMSKYDDLQPCLTLTIDELENWLVNDPSELVKENILKYNYRTNGKEAKQNYKDSIIKSLFE